MFLYLKALHLIFVVTWFAGLFYMVRLFVYMAECQNKEDEERRILSTQFKIMQKRLWYGIAWPSAVLTLCFGLSMLFYFPVIPTWLWIKLGLVFLLFLYHISCHVIFSNQQKEKKMYTSMQMRIYNEVATLFLVSIIFLAVLKNMMALAQGLIGLIILMAVLFAAIKIYKINRIKREEKKESTLEK